jgi:hypothetical protein
VLETGNWKPGFWNPHMKTLILGCWAKKQQLTEKKVQNLGLTAESCRKPKTKLKLELKFKVNLRLETQTWKPGPDLEMKNLEMRSWIPGLL